MCVWDLEAEEAEPIDRRQKRVIVSILRDQTLSGCQEMGHHSSVLFGWKEEGRRDWGYPSTFKGAGCQPEDSEDVLGSPHACIWHTRGLTGTQSTDPKGGGPQDRGVGLLLLAPSPTAQRVLGVHQCSRMCAEWTNGGVSESL